MKLNRPRVESYTSPDGHGSLTYVGMDTSHDMGGSDYRFLYREGEEEIEISARVQSIPRANHAARDQGVDLWSMSFEESESFKQAYYEANPREYQVIRFFAETPGRGFDLPAAAKQFCNLFLELNASYRFNNSDYPETGDGYYWERVFFQPYDAEPKLHFQQSVGIPQ